MAGKFLKYNRKPGLSFLDSPGFEYSLLIQIHQLHAFHVQPSVKAVICHALIGGMADITI